MLPRRLLQVEIVPWTTLVKSHQMLTTTFCSRKKLKTKRCSTLICSQIKARMMMMAMRKKMMVREAYLMKLDGSQKMMQSSPQRIPGITKKALETLKISSPKKMKTNVTRMSVTNRRVKLRREIGQRK